MAMFKYTSTSSSLSSPTISSSDSSGVDIHRGAFEPSPPQRAQRDEAAAAGAYGGMGWGISMGPIQFQRNTNRRALLWILYTEIYVKLKNSTIQYDEVHN
jgi:hypothetical protein